MYPWHKMITMKTHTYIDVCLANRYIKETFLVGDKYVLVYKGGTTYTQSFFCFYNISAIYVKEHEG